MTSKSAAPNSSAPKRQRSYGYFGNSGSGTPVALENGNTRPEADMNLRVLLVDPDSGHSEMLAASLQGADCEIVVSIRHVDGIEAHLRRTQPDLALVFRDFADPELIDQLTRVMQTDPLPIVMFVEESPREATQAAVRAGISAYVVAGWEPARLRPILDAAVERYRQFDALRTELASTRNQLAERKRIERAKGILMRARGLNEEQAFQAMRKQAMDRNKRLIDVAENIIAASELLTN